MTNNGWSSPMLWVLVLSLWTSPAQAGEIRGSVRLDGPAPKPVAVPIEPKKGVHSTEGCGSLQKLSPKLMVSETGGIRNAVVWLDLPAREEGSAAEASALINQKECVFDPHVVSIPAGKTLAIRNSDSVLHNIRIFQEGKPAMLMHQWQKADAADILWRFAEPGRYIVRCGVHPWMYAWVVVTSGVGAVTNREGQFTISGVAPGEYTLHVWHETLGTREVPMAMKAPEEILKPIRFALAEDS